MQSFTRIFLLKKKLYYSPLGPLPIAQTNNLDYYVKHNGPNQLPQQTYPPVIRPISRSSHFSKYNTKISFQRQNISGESKRKGERGNVSTAWTTLNTLSHIASICMPRNYKCISLIRK
jgi:hypothetical protein